MPVFWKRLDYFARHPPTSAVARWYFGMEKTEEPDRRPSMGELLTLAGRRP